MNNCEHLRTLLSPMLDGELSIDEAHRLTEHLKDCAKCQQAWQAYQELDNRLRKSIHLPSVGTQCHDIERMARLVKADIDVPKHVRILDSSSAHAWYGLAWFVTLVACLTIMLISPAFRPGAKKTTSTLQINVIGHLVRATGAVEVRESGSQQWRALSTADARPLLSGVSLRTRSDVLCEVETSDKGLIRLGQSAEIVFQNQSSVQVITGQVWCRAPSNRPIELDLLRESSLDFKGPLASLTCPGSTEMQCVNNESLTSCQSVAGNAINGQLTVGQFTCPVAPGETVSIDAARQVERHESAELNSKIWQLPLLAIDASPDGELMQMMRPVLASLGMSKARHMNEVQIRALGPIGAIPLLVYAETERGASQTELRRRAVWLAGEIADARSLPWLRKLQEDADTQVAEAARATANRLKD